MPMTIIINKCYESGDFPAKWKCSEVVPVNKNEDRNDVNNFKPLTVVSLLSKIVVDPRNTPTTNSHSLTF